MQSLAVSKYRKRKQDKYKRKCERLARMRAAKQRRHNEEIAAGWTTEPPPGRIVRHPNISWAMRDDISGEVVWMEFKSVRDMAKRASMVARFYQPARNAWTALTNHT
jgi:hypothetical protein